MSNHNTMKNQNGYLHKIKNISEEEIIGDKGLLCNDRWINALRRQQL